jgi:hypothetical protein
MTVSTRGGASGRPSGRSSPLSSNNTTPLHSRLHPCSGWGGDHVGRAVGPRALRRAGWHTAAHVRLLSMGPGRPVPSTARCSARAARSRPWWCPEAVRDVSPGTSPGCADRRCWLGVRVPVHGRPPHAIESMSLTPRRCARPRREALGGRPNLNEHLGQRAPGPPSPIAYDMCRGRGAPKPDRRRRRTCRTGRGRPESRPADERHRGRDITQPPARWWTRASRAGEPPAGHQHVPSALRLSLPRPGCAGPGNVRKPVDPPAGHPSRTSGGTVASGQDTARHARGMRRARQIIDVYVSRRRNAAAARRFFDRALATAVIVPGEVVTDRAAAYLGVLEHRLPEAWHRTERYANNRIEAGHGQLKRRLRPMRGLKTDAGAPHRDRRARLRPEPPPRTLRTRR